MNVPDAPSSDRKRGRQRSTDHTTPSPARRRGCNCKKSGCLKLYCECFAANVRCGERCQCLGCKNREHNRLEIAHAMETIERRTQKSFKSPLAVARKLETLRNTTPGGIPMDQSVLDGATRLLMSAERLEEAPTPVVHPECICSAGACSTACPCHQKYGDCGQRCPCKAVPMSQEKTRGCSCKKSNCLKLYCECLGAQRYCDSRCNCEGCKNRPDNQAERERAISAILERNPLAFQPKVASGASQHLRGCNCRKSNCMKNYCECHQAGVPCTSRCACQGCRNTETFVSAKKMLVFGAESKTDASSPDMSERSAASTGKPPRRPQRRVSMDLSASPSQLRTPIAQRPSALELLSRTAPPAPPQALVFGQTSSSIVKRKLGDASRTVDSHPSGFERRKFTKIASARPSFKDRLDKASRVVKVLPPVEGTLDAEYNSSASDLPLSKLCRSLIRAAGSVDSELNNDGGDSVMEEVDGDDKRNGSSKAASQPDEGSRGPLSPTTETLMCEEDIETPGRNAYSSDMPQNNEPDVGSPQIKKEENQERRIQLAALQERAVLQEFSVWLRNLSTGSSLSQ